MLLEQRTRDRLLCYVLAAIMGPVLVPTLTQPEQQEPSILMGLPVSGDGSVQCSGCLVEDDAVGLLI